MAYIVAKKVYPPSRVRARSPQPEMSSIQLRDTTVPIIE